MVLLNYTMVYTKLCDGFTKLCDGLTKLLLNRKY